MAVIKDMGQCFRFEWHFLLLMVPLRDLVLCWAARNSSRFSFPLTASHSQKKTNTYQCSSSGCCWDGEKCGWHISLGLYQVFLMSRLPQDTREFVVLTYCGNDVTHLELQVLFTLQEFGNQQLQGRILHNDLMSDW